MKQIGYLLIIILSAALLLAVKQIEDLQEQHSIATENIKAFSSQLDSTKRSATAYKMTIEQLNFFGDSIMKELDNTRRELKIKEKNVKTLQYVGSTFSKTDTITLKDTLFKDACVSVDTTLGNEWYSIRLGLNYPSSIMVKPEVRSEKHIVTSARKETVNPPKKFFLFKWFQKKHTVVQVDIVEKNPYIKTEDSRYIEVVK